MNQVKALADKIEQALHLEYGVYEFARLSENQEIEFVSGLPFNKIKTSEKTEMFILKRQDFDFDILITNRVLRKPVIWVYMRGIANDFVTTIPELLHWMEEQYVAQIKEKIKLQ